MTLWSERLPVLRASLRRQKGAVAALAALAVFYVGFMAFMKARSVSVVQQFWDRHAAWHEGAVAERLRELEVREGLPLPLALDLARIAEEPSVGLVGFSVPEPWGIWTHHPNASLLIKLAQAPATEVTLTVRVHAFVAKGHPRQRAQVRIDGSAQGSWSFLDGEGPQTFVLRIPPGTLADRLVRIHFSMPDVTSPSHLRIGRDGRFLGLGLEAVSLAVAQDAVSDPPPAPAPATAP